jgi:hypothetical protein
MDQQNNQIFRKKSLERLSSPEDLNAYLHVTNPAVWIILTAVILLLVGLFVWSSVTTVESRVIGEAIAEKGVLQVTFPDNTVSKQIQPGMEVTIGSVSAEISSVTTDAEGKMVVVAMADIPDGKYEASVGYKSTRILQLLFN